jgi:3D (Asp-Asp-Asp) domain-containing protein
MRRRWIIIDPARLSVVEAAAVNAKVGPATQRIGGLIPAEATTTAAPVDPYVIPSGSVVVVQSNRVAKRIGESVDVDEGGAAVG